MGSVLCYFYFLPQPFSVVGVEMVIRYHYCNCHILYAPVVITEQNLWLLFYIYHTSTDVLLLLLLLSAIRICQLLEADYAYAYLRPFSLLIKHRLIKRFVFYWHCIYLCILFILLKKIGIKPHTCHRRMCVSQWFIVCSLFGTSVIYGQLLFKL